MKIKVAIADDHLLVTNGLKSMLETAEQLELVFTCHDGQSLLEKLEREKPDVILLDIQMPGMTGIELCKVIKETYPSIELVALTNLEETHYVKQMIRNGALGYLLKNTDTTNLIRAIESVHNKQQYLDNQIEKQMLNELLSGKKKESSQAVLTKRESEILALILAFEMR